MEAFRPLAMEASERAKVDANLLLAIVWTESGGDPSARSSAGALGLMQLKLAAAADAAQWLGEPKPTAQDLFDPRRNLRLGAAYFRILLDRFGDPSVALVAYLKGPTWVAESGGPAAVLERLEKPSQAATYVQKALERSRRLARLR